MDNEPPPVYTPEEVREIFRENQELKALIAQLYETINRHRVGIGKGLELIPADYRRPVTLEGVKE